MILKNYQEIAVKELLAKAQKLLGYSGSKKLVFKAPTGSGKTIMMAEFLRRLVDNQDIKQELTFIWAAPRQLHLQSKEKFERYFSDTQALECKIFDDLTDRQISQNEILFFNWESINKKDKNTIVKENEKDFYLSKILENTREEGRKIILVIDESHFSAGSKEDSAAKQLRDDINANLTIEVSATPLLEGDEDVKVQIEDVKIEGMIKKAVVLNEDFTNLKTNSDKVKSDLSGGSEELVIAKAMEKLKEISKAYEREHVTINPLLLIQLPDRVGSLEDRMKEKVIEILKNKYKISDENGKLAIWLSGEHVNKEDVEKPDSKVEVLIFKQAIALGWDCPRAQILVLFRQWHSPVFSIQTVGRIMRMPEPDKGHYDQDVLNYGYVYTNIDNIEIQEDIAKDYITIFVSKRKHNYRPINLLSCHSVRHREKTRLSPLFTKLFLNRAKDYRLKDKLDLNDKKLDLKIVADWKAEDIDALAGAKIVAEKSINASDFDLQKLFDYFVRRHLSPFYPDDRSVGRIKEAVYTFYQKELEMDYEHKQKEILQIFLSQENSKRFADVIDAAKAAYIEDVSKREFEIAYDDNWNVPEKIMFGSKDKKVDLEKSITQPFYSDDRWETERAFVELLNNSKQVDWWFKNGQQDAIFFAVPYEDSGQRPFYVDFLVQFKDGRIGLFDTKSGRTISDAKGKSDGLQAYIKSENNKGRKIFGGIIANTDSKKFTGRWLVYVNKGANLKAGLFDGWENLVI